MTVEERAQEYTGRIDGAGDIWSKVIEQMEAALRDQIEEAAKLTDDEAIRLEAVSMEYKQKGDSETAIQFSANVVTAAKLGRDIRALAEPKPETEGKGDIEHDQNR